MIPSLFILPFIISVIMLIWFKSDAFIDYAELFGLNRFIKEKEFRDERLVNPTVSYPLFLKMKCGENKLTKFLFKLIGCRLCSSIWLSAILSIIISSSLINFISYTCISCIISLFIFGHVSKLLDEN